MPRMARTKRSKRNLEAASIALAAASSISTVNALPSATTSMGNSLAKMTAAASASAVRGGVPAVVQPLSVHSALVSSTRSQIGPFPTVVTSRFFATSSNKEDTQIVNEAKVESQDVNVVERTQSFGPLWHGLYETKDPVKIHTLMLGTHPSITSLGKSQYFGHNMNAFWWIAGDCLGFRRDTAISPSSGKPYKLASDLKYGIDKIIPYDEQLKTFTANGFALWDVLESCERKGSLDTAIQKEIPNKIQEFCKEHPSIKRIVMANGSTQCIFFNRHFKDWWESGELKPADTEVSKKAFQKYAKKTNNFENASIECLVGLGVSPAAAKFSYKEKRDFYDRYCYEPGLLDQKELNS